MNSPKTGADLVKWREAMGWTQQQAASAMCKGRRKYQFEETASVIHPTASMMAFCLLEVRQGRSTDSISTQELKGIIERTDALAKPMGRPKKDAELQALEALVDAVERAERDLRTNPDYVGRRATQSILDQLVVVKALRAERKGNGK